MMKAVKIKGAVAAASLGVLAVAGCSGGSATPRVTDEFALTTQEGAHAFFADLSGMREARNTVQVGRSFSDFLPNQEFKVDGASAAPIATGVVIGEVTDVRPGKGYYIPKSGPQADADQGTETTFDDPRAIWSVAEVTIAVQDNLGLKDPTSVRVGVTVINPDKAAVLRGIKSLGDVVVVLDRTGFYEYDPSLYNVADFGNLFGDVDASGVIGFPALEKEGNAAFVGDLHSWDRVRAAADQQTAPITVDQSGRRL